MEANIDRYIEEKISVSKRNSHVSRRTRSQSRRQSRRRSKSRSRAKSLNARMERNIYERHAILMVGIPGSGKSGTKTKCIRQFPGIKFVNIDVDEFLEKFYNNDRTQYSGAYPLFNRLVDATIEKGLNMVIDGTGKDLHAIINRLYRAHYSVNLCINMVNLEVSKERAAEREKRTGRKVNDAYIRQVADLLKVNIPLYLENPKINEIFIYSNNGTNQEREFICKKSSGCNLSDILSLLD
jgi:predicted ABC-type ATPase